MIPQKAAKILALALDPAAHDGEWNNAAVMFIAVLRKAGCSPAVLDRPSPPPSSSPWITRMPFGKHKGKALSDIPTDYLEWLMTLPDIRPPLRRDVTAELNERA